MTTPRMRMPDGMTASDHDRIADDFAREATALRVIVDRLDARVDTHRQTALALREMYKAIREHNERR